MRKLGNVEGKVTVDHANGHCDLEAAEVCTPLWQVQHDLESLGEETAAA